MCIGAEWGRDGAYLNTEFNIMITIMVIDIIEYYEKLGVVDKVFCLQRRSVWIRDMESKKD